MNVLEKLGQALTKHVLKSPSLQHEEILLSSFEKARPLSVDKSKRIGSSKAPVNECVKSNLSLVGRGSSFQKKVVKEYLSPLRSHPFSRHEITDDYEVDKATRMSNWGKHVKGAKNSQEIIISSSYQFIGDMLAALVACTPRSIQVVSEDILRIFPKYTIENVPKIPSFQNDSHLFQDYIGMLTHTNFLFKNSSRLNGIIPKLLRNLMHPGNVKTMNLRATQNYNDLIYFYSEKFDFASCRETFVQMKIEGISSNTTTYNLMLRSILKNSHIRKTKPPDDEILFYLRRMKAENIKADTVTWTTCYNFLNEDISRLIFVEQMELRSIPITQRFIYTVLKNGSYGSKDYLKFLSDHRIPLDQKLFNLCIDNLLSEERSDIAWIFMEHTLRKRTKDFKLGAATLNSFVRYFADKGRLDMALITFNTCVTQYQIYPNIESFDMLFKALAKNGYTKKFPIIFEYFKRLRARWSCGNRTSYWTVRCKSMIEFSVAQKRLVTELDLERADSLLATINWVTIPNGFTMEIWKNSGPEVRRILRYLSCIPMPLKQMNFTVSKDLEKSEKRKRFREKIRFIAVQNAMYKRIPYSKDWYGSLKSELEERNVIERAKDATK